jgi:hypothetical protein
MTGSGECENTLCACTTSKCPVRQEGQPQVADEGQPGQLVLQAVVGDDIHGAEQDVGGDVDAVVAAQLQVADQQPPGPQVAAADVQDVVRGRQAVRPQVVELELADGEPRLMGLAADRALPAAGRVRAHHRPVVPDVIAAAQRQPRIPPPPPRVAGDPVGVLQGISELVGQP